MNDEVLLRAGEAGNAPAEELGIDLGGDGFVEVDGEIFLGKFDGVEFFGVLIEGGDEGFHVADFLPVDFANDEVAEAFVADGGGSRNGAAEKDDPIGLVLVFLGIF